MHICSRVSAGGDGDLAPGPRLPGGGRPSLECVGPVGRERFRATSRAPEAEEGERAPLSLDPAVCLDMAHAPSVSCRGTCAGAWPGPSMCAGTCPGPSVYGDVGNNQVSPCRAQLCPCRCDSSQPGRRRGRGRQGLLLLHGGVCGVRVCLQVDDPQGRAGVQGEATPRFSLVPPVHTAPRPGPTPPLSATEVRWAVPPLGIRRELEPGELGTSEWLVTGLLSSEGLLCTHLPQTSPGSRERLLLPQ